LEIEGDHIFWLIPVLSGSGDNLAIPHDSDSSGNDILPTLGGHLYVHPSSVLLVGRGHLDVPPPVP